MPRIYFLGRKFAVSDEGKAKEAKAALTRARATQKKWKSAEWEYQINKVLLKYRKGIQWGGRRIVVASKKKKTKLPKRPNSSAFGDKQRGASSAAVGDTQKRANPQRVTGNSDHKNDTGAPDSTIRAESQLLVESRSDVLPPREAAIGAHGVIGLLNRLRIQPPCTLVGGGAFGKVYRMSAVPWSAATGSVVTQTVAVKVVSKMDDNISEEQTQVAKHARREIALLTMVAGSPGIVELLSWSEGLFDVHLAFRVYTEDLQRYTQRGALKVVEPGRSDELPSICKQLLTGLSRLHELQILHRDVKPLNMLVHMSAVGDVGGVKSTRAVLADLGGACQMTAGVGFLANPVAVGVQESEPTTYQYRAPELFVCKRFRRCSYPCDVWAMGVSIAHMDLGNVPFGRLQMRRSQMEDIFADQLRVLCKANSGMFDVHVREDPTQFLKKLGSLKLREASCLPWGRSRGTVFQNFLREFFFLSPESRPLARTLVRETALRR